MAKSAISWKWLVVSEADSGSHTQATSKSFMSCGSYLPFPVSRPDYPPFLPKLRNHSLTSILVWLILVRPTRESISIPLTPCSSAVSVVLLEFRTPEGLTNNESLGCTRCKSRENQGSFTACFWSCAYTPAAYLAAVQPTYSICPYPPSDWLCSTNDGQRFETSP
jgi:hypothetical protein